MSGPERSQDFHAADWPHGARCAMCEESFLEGEAMWSQPIEEYKGVIPPHVLADAAAFKAQYGRPIYVTVCAACAGRAA